MARQTINQTQILSAAIKIINQSGLQNLSLAALAKVLGIKTSSLYNHIKSLSDLKKTLGIYGIEKLQQTLEKSLIGRSGDEAIYALAESYVNFVREHPGLYEATFPSEESLDEAFSEAGTRIVDLVLFLLRDYELEKEVA